MWNHLNHSELIRETHNGALLLRETSLGKLALMPIVLNIF